MKRIDKLQSSVKAIFTSLCLVLLLWSCTENEIDSQPATPDYFTVTFTVDDEISFGQNAANKFSVESSLPWEATIESDDDEDWCSLSGYASADVGLIAEIYISVEANLSTEPRSAVITVSADDTQTPQVINITQMGYGAQIVLSQSELTVTSSGGSTATFTVTSTSSWVIEDNDYFTLEHNEGEGDPYLTDDPTLVTATAKATNTSSTDDIITEMYISNSDDKSASIIFTQQKSVALLFADASALTAEAAGQTFEIAVTTDSEAWKMYCSNSAASIDYSNFESDGTVAVTIPKNTSFGSRSMTLSLKSDDGLVESTDNITISQATYNSNFNYSDYINGSYIISDEGVLTITNSAAAKSRISSKDNTYGMGTYTFLLDYNGDDNSYFGFQAQDTGTDLFNLSFGSNAPASYYRNTANTINNPPTFAATTAHLNAMSKMVISVLPDAADGTKMNLVVELISGDEDVLYSYSLQTTNYYTADPTFTNDMYIYFGVCSTVAGGNNTVAISSFDFDAYDPTAVAPDTDGDSDDDEYIVPLSLFSDTSWLNGTATYINDGDGVTLTHTSGTSSRLAYLTTDLLFGTYTYKFSDYQGSSDTYFNMHLDIDGYTTDRVILYIGPGAPVSIVKVDGTVVNTISVKPTLEQMEAMEDLVISILPKSGDDSKMEVITTLYDASGAVLYTQTIENNNYSDSVAPYNIMYMGVWGTASQSITIESLKYEPYAASATDPEPDGDDSTVTLDFATLNYTSYLNGTYSINNDGSLTITHSSGTQSRFCTDDVDGMSIFGMGTYTIEFSDYSGTDDSFINLQAVTASASTEQYNINIGPSAAQSVLKSSLGLWAAVTDLTPTIDQLKAMKTLTISLLPVETNTNNMNLTVSIDGTVLSSTGGMANFAVTNEDFVNDMTLYFGVGGSTTGSSITIDSLTYSPYVAGN